MTKYKINCQGIKGDKVPKEKMEVALLKRLAKMTTTPKKNSVLKWKFRNGVFDIRGFETVLDGKVYFCFFDPAEGYSLSIYKEGEGIPGLNGIEALSIQGFCYKPYFDMLFDKATKQCRKEIAEFKKEEDEKDKKNRQSYEKANREYSEKLAKELKLLTKKN